MNAEIKIKFNPGNANHVEALNVLINAVGETVEPTKKAAEPETEAPKAKTRKSRAKKAEPEKEPEPNPAEDQEEESADETTTSITVDQIRALVTKKAKASKTEIKAKLTELKADNVTLLKKEDYEEFHAFLLEL